MKKTIMALLFLAACAGMAARPNWGELTDGRFVYYIEGDEEYNTITLQATDRETDVSYYIFLDKCEGSGEWRTISDAQSKYPSLKLPPGYHAGDSVYYYGEGAVFFNSDGLVYTSMKRYRSYEKPAETLTESQALLFAGLYEISANKEMIIYPRESDDSQPTLSFFSTNGDSGNDSREPMTILTDVMAPDGTALLNVQTPKRHWLLGITAEGLKVYKALPAGKSWKAGKLLYQAKLMDHLVGSGGRIACSNEHLIFTHHIDRYCSKELMETLCQQQETQKDGGCEFFYNKLRLLLKHRK